MFVYCLYTERYFCLLYSEIKSCIALAATFTSFTCTHKYVRLKTIFMYLNNFKQQTIVKDGLSLKI